MMMCPDMETETIVLNALNETKSFSMKDDKVYLLGENGNELLVLKNNNPSTFELIWVGLFSHKRENRPIAFMALC